MTDVSTLIALASGITAIGGAYLTLRKIAKDGERSKKVYAAEILHSAKEEDALIKAKMEIKISKIEAELAHMKLDIAKDLNHLRENHSKEIENLLNKVEQIREDFRNSHSQLVLILSKMVDRD